MATCSLVTFTRMPAAGVTRCGSSQKGQEFSRQMPGSIVYTGRFRRDVEIQTIGSLKLEIVGLLHPKISNEATSNAAIFGACMSPLAPSHLRANAQSRRQPRQCLCNSQRRSRQFRHGSLERGLSRL